MSNLGLGVMLHMLGGSDKESVAAVQKSIGKEIQSVELANDALRLVFTDGSGLNLKDDGQSCCENRYMRTDDDLSHYVGATLQDFEIREAPDAKDEDGDGTHEVQFLAVKTSKGEFVMSSHNEHNGYYGGFSIVARSTER